MMSLVARVTRVRVGSVLPDVEEEGEGNVCRGDGEDAARKHKRKSEEVVVRESVDSPTTNERLREGDGKLTST